MDVDLLLLIGAVVLLLAMIAARYTAPLGLPSLLIFLAFGVGLGALGARITNFDLAHGLAFAALVLILSEGGFNTRWSEVRPVLGVSIMLAVVGVGVAVAVVAVFSYYVLSLDLPTSLLLGAVTAPTDAAAIFSVLRSVPLPARLRSILEAESGLNDAPVVLLVATGTELALGQAPEGGLPVLAGIVALELVGGLLVGYVFGYVSVRFMRSVALPATGLYPLAAMSWVLLAYGFATAVHVAGFAAVYVCALMLGNSQLPHRGATKSFAEGIGWVCQIGLFIMLGVLAEPETLTWSLIGTGLLVGFVVTFLARPLSTIVCTVWFRISWREHVFLSWAGLRGAVPIVMAIVPLAAGVPKANYLFQLVFVYVVVFTVLQAPTLTAMAKLTRCAEPPASVDIEVEIAPLGRIQADFMQVNVPPDSHLPGVNIQELRLPRNTVVSTIIRDGQAFTPGAMDVLRAGDDMLIVVPSALRAQVEERLQQIGRSGRLANWLEGG